MKNGRTRVTTHAAISHAAFKLFDQHGFENTTVDDIAEAAGIGRRTFFRYFASKNDLPWGEFDALLERMRIHLAETTDETPLVDALLEAVLVFNAVPESEIEFHRQRMRLILNVPSLIAHSTLRYASWRAVVAEFVASRLGTTPDSLSATTVAWACLGLCLGAYEQWTEHPGRRLPDILNEAFTQAEHIFGV